MKTLLERLAIEFAELGNTSQEERLAVAKFCQFANNYLNRFPIVGLRALGTESQVVLSTGEVLLLMQPTTREQPSSSGVVAVTGPGTYTPEYKKLSEPAGPLN